MMSKTVNHGSNASFTPLRVDVDEPMDESDDSEIDEEEDGKDEANEEEWEEMGEADDGNHRLVSSPGSLPSTFCKKMAFSAQSTLVDDYDGYHRDLDYGTDKVTMGYQNQVHASYGMVTPLPTPITTSLSSTPTFQPVRRIQHKRKGTGAEDGDGDDDGVEYSDGDEDDEYGSDDTERGACSPGRQHLQRPRHNQVHEQKGLHQHISPRTTQSNINPAHANANANANPDPDPDPQPSSKHAARAAKRITKSKEYHDSHRDLYVQLEAALLLNTDWIRPGVPQTSQNAASSRLTYQKKDLLSGAVELLCRRAAELEARRRGKKR